MQFLSHKESWRDFSASFQPELETKSKTKPNLKTKILEADSKTKPD